MIERWAIWLFAGCNVLLYASVLPLWEGFDEPFHYGYVQYLWTQRQFPVTGKAALSDEVWHSLHVNPGSYLVKRNLPFVETYEDWLRRGGVRDNSPEGDKYRLVPAALNYEAQQAPLAYVVLTVPDMLLSHVALPLRIWMLRVLCGGAGIALFLTAMLRLIPSPAAWFSALCIQMLYASTVHVSNDWLAISLAAWLAVACIEKRPWVASAILTAGLLTKAYFLAFIPIVVFVCRRRPQTLALLLIAAPWYVRNWMLYGNIGGVFISAPKMSMWEAATSIDWLRWTDYILHAGLWTGNNSFTSFSHLTLDALLILFAIAIIKARARCWTCWAMIAAMIAVLVYSTILLRAYTGGETTGTGVWYIPAMYAPLLFLASWRGWLACAISVLSAYILIATYWMKLIPMYGGFTGRSTLPALFDWYRSGPHVAAYLAPPALIYVPAVVLVTIAAVVLTRHATPGVTEPSARASSGRPRGSGRSFR